MKILLADDSMTAQNMGKKILTDAGFEVIAVSNGAAALKKIAAENPDIVILDVFMPGYTGLEVCERLKNNPATSRKPVLLTVGKMEPFNPDDSNRVRAEGVMIKPFEATDLTAAVEAIAKRFNIPRNTAPPSPPTPPPQPQNHRSYEETVMMSQDELRQAMGPDSSGPAITEAASTAATAAAAVAVAAPAMEIGLDSAAIVSEHEEIKPARTTTAPDAEAPAKPVVAELHSPFSHASVAREVVEHPATPVTSSEPAAWDPVLDGIAIPASVVTPEPEPPQPLPEAQPMFGLEYAVPASVAQETPGVAEEEEPVATPAGLASPVHPVEELHAVVSPSAYLAQASAAMEIETSHPIVGEVPLVESTPDFEPNVAPPVQVETHAEKGIEPGIEQPSPELTVPPDPSLVGGTDSFSAFTTHFGVDNPEEIPVGIVPELMPDANSSYEYQPPEEGHAYEDEADTETTTGLKSEAEPAPPAPVVASAPSPSWEMVSVEADASPIVPSASVPEVITVEDAPVRDEPATVQEESEFRTPAASESPLLPTIRESAHETPVAEPAEQPFDPDATQALPEEFFTTTEPQLETTAELVGASVPESVIEPAPEPTAASVEEFADEVHRVAPVEEVSAATSSEAEPAPVAQTPATSLEPSAPFVSSIATEPAILSVGPEPPSVPEEPVVETPRIEQPSSIETPAIAAAAAAGAAALGATIAEHFVHAAEAHTAVPEEAEPAVGDQTQVFIASAVARVLDRMKPTLIEEIAREMANKRKPRKDPEE